VPSGTYDIQIDGPAATGTSSVDLTITASQNIDVENGVFKGEYNTISIPPGQFKVTVAGETKTITLRSPGSSSGGSGSSGGGGGSTPDSSDNNVDVEELSTKRVFSNTPVEFRFSNPEVPIKSINLTSAITVMNVPVRIEVLKDTSVMVKKEPNGNVYKHINIWVGNAGFAIPENIKSAKVIFQVENNWIEDNNIDNIEPKSVVLMHYEEDADQWTRLPTDMISKDDQYTLYQANVTHFSPFAIAEEARQTTNTDNQTDSNQTNTTAENGQQDSSETPANSRQGLNAEWILIGGVVAGLVAMTAWKMKKNRQ
jgi:PGF-pre-PGF domain-containing protein